jgi:hypothetical protein
MNFHYVLGNIAYQRDTVTLLQRIGVASARPLYRGPGRTAITETDVITRVFWIQAGEPPPNSAIPRFLRIIAETATGPLIIRIAEERALRELAIALALHLLGPLSRS